METEQKNQKQALKEEIYQYLDDLYGFGMSLCRNAQDAQDLVSETVLKALQNLDKYELNTNLKAWLFTILRNTYFNQHKRKKKFFEDIMGVFERKFSLHVQLSIEGKDKTDQQDLLNPEKVEVLFGDEVVSALNDLSEDYREIIFLCDVQELTYDEIAVILNIPVGTVRSRISRARSKLQKALWDYANKKGILKS